MGAELNYFWILAEIAVPICVLSVLTYLALQFRRGFWLPANSLEIALDDAIEKLQAQLQSGDAKTQPQLLRESFEGTGILQHAWRQYEETLHQPTQINTETGEIVPSEARSTVPSEMFFPASTVVDTQVRAEFFKHLPGIFTGIGIIGTFAGLIVGLLQFNITDDPRAATASLNALLSAVAFAFIGSLFSIIFAMAATFLEKYKLNLLYAKVELLQKILDESYRAGVGEEYLSRLVSSSEENSSQTRILKDALVSDLKQILTDLSDKQISAATQGATQLRETIADTLREPLDRIAGGVSRVGEDQSAAVTKLLTDVLAGFSDKLEGLFGDQISGIGEMQRRTIEAMESAVGKLHELTGNMEAAGTRATDTMAERLEAALQAAESRQQAMTAAMSEAMQDMLTALRDHSAQSGETTQRQISSLMDDLGNRLGSAIANIENSSSARAEEQRIREERQAYQAQEQSNALGDQVSNLTNGVESLIKAVGTMTDRLDSSTGAMVTKLNSGAETLLTAASKFEKSGITASESFTRIAGVSEGLNSAAATVASAARSLDSVVGDYRAARDSVASMLSTIQETVQAATREAALTTDIIASIETAAKKLIAAQGQADRYLDEVTDVLTQSHQSFADNMRKTVGEANTQFHQQLAQATGLLRDTIQDLELALPSGNMAGGSR
jgi:hypothetical protein